MDSFLGKLKSAADKAGSTASSAQEKVIQEYLPKIIIILREKAGPAVLDILSDVDKLAELSRSAYQALPMPVRMVVKEQSFIDWVVSHQDTVLDKLRSQLALEGGSVQVAEDSLLPGASDSLDESSVENKAP